MMDKLDKIIEILEKQLVSIQVLEKKTSSFYANGFRRAIFMIKKLSEELQMEDKKLVCKDCGKEFVFTGSESNFYTIKGFPEPKRCPECRKARKLQSIEK